MFEARSQAAFTGTDPILCLDHDGHFLHRECVRDPRGLLAVSEHDQESWAEQYGEAPTCEVCGR